MRKILKYTLILALQFLFFTTLVNAQNEKGQKNENQYKIDISGNWRFQVDSLDNGIIQRWFTKRLEDKVKLPGSMTTNGKGNEITVSSPWTGSIIDSSWFFKPEYAQYRQSRNIKVPFWLQPVKYYKGAAWYQKTVTIPASWKGKQVALFIERSHWETTVWVDNKQVGMQNSLATAHIFDLTEALSPGAHQLTIRVDNRIRDFNVGQNSHSISDHTQSNWNGMVEQLYMVAHPTLYIDDVQLYPDVQKKQVVASIRINNISGEPFKANLKLSAISNNPQAQKLKLLTKAISIKGDGIDLEVVYPMGKNPLLWDEFHPNLYTLKMSLSGDGNSVEKNVDFGMRNFGTQGTQFTINGRLTFLRGTLECAIFPETGYPPTDVNSWMRIFKICRSYGLNHIRFHSWCPPEAAFEAAE